MTDPVGSEEKTLEEFFLYEYVKQVTHVKLLNIKGLGFLVSEKNIIKVGL